MDIRKALSIALIAAFVPACAEVVRPTDMSQAAHEAAAREHSIEATIDAAEGRDDDAEDHWELAADHLRASAALKVAEESACTGLTELERGSGPFANRDAIVRIETLRAHPATVEWTEEIARLTGVRVTMRKEAGVTEEHLQRLVNCDLARSASAGFTPGWRRSPLSVKGARATVEADGNLFKIDIKADTEAAAESIACRARSLRRW